MEYDEIVFAVGELYLKFRKQQQISGDLGREVQAQTERADRLESEKEELERFQEQSDKEIEKLKAKARRRAAK